MNRWAGYLASRTTFYYGWVVAGAVSLTMMLAGSLSAPLFSVFIDPLTKEFGWSRTSISAGFSIGTIAAAVVGPLVGRTLDRYGGRVVLGGGAFMMGASLVALGFVVNLVMFYIAFSVGRTAMMSIQNLASHTVLANWFVRRRALASAVAINGSRAGLALWPLLASAVLVLAGWRAAFWVIGGTVGMLGLIPLILVVARRPEQVGLLPDGAPAPGGRADHETAPSQHQWSVGNAIHTNAFWLLMLAHLTIMMAGGAVGVHRVPYFVQQGLSDLLVGLMLTSFAIGMGLGGFIAAWASHRVPPRYVVAAALLGSAAALLVLLEVPPNATAVAYGLVEGALFGGTFALIPVLYADYFGRTSIGTIRGLTHPVVVAANALGPLYAGILFDLQDTYTWAFITMSAVLVIGAVAAWLAAPPQPVDTVPARQDTGRQ